jgi:hypothetical protein
MEGPDLQGHGEEEMTKKNKYIWLRKLRITTGRLRLEGTTAAATTTSTTTTAATPLC